MLDYNIKQEPLRGLLGMGGGIGLFSGPISGPQLNQILDTYSLTFNAADVSHLTRTGSAGNSKIWTYSCWIKRHTLQQTEGLFSAGTSGSDYTSFYFQDNEIKVEDYLPSGQYRTQDNASFRDTNAWMHLVISCDTTIDPERVKIYINNQRVTWKTEDVWVQDRVTRFNSVTNHSIGTLYAHSTSYSFDGSMSQFHWIDGQALTPSSFGTVDSVTGVWKPIEYTGTYGTNGSYLPMDGQNPVGKDMSGSGNDWIPVNFGGLVTLDRATGALPILNTISGGNYASGAGGGKFGVRTGDSFASYLTFALPLNGQGYEVGYGINSNSNIKVPTTLTGTANNTGNCAFYNRTITFNGTSNYISYPSDTDYDQDGDFTLEYWIYPNSVSNYITPVGRNTNWITIQLSSDANGGIRIVNYAASTAGTGGKPIPVGQWTHLALVRSGTTVTAYVNGVATVSGTDSTSTSPGSPLDIGRNGSTYPDYLNGSLQDVRYYKGVAKYTSNFIPPSINPPIRSSGISRTTDTITNSNTYGSVHFNGDPTESNAGLLVNTNIDYSTDFTIEGFMFPKTAGGRVLYDAWMGNTSGTGFYVWLQPNGSINLVKDSSTYYDTGFAGVASFYLRAWNHFAIVRSGNNLKIYINGVNRSGTGFNITDSWSSSRGGIIGSGQGNGSMAAFSGWISNVRISSEAVYTNDFVPPSGPLTSTPNTQVLCCNYYGSPISATTGSVSNIGGMQADNFNPFDISVTSATRYPTLNALALSGGATLSNGNLNIQGSTAYRTIPATVGITSGKYYWEYYLRSYDTGTDVHLGICLGNFSDFRDTWVLSTQYGWGFTCQGGYAYHNNSATISLTTARSDNDTIGFTFDADNGNLYVYVNGEILNGGSPIFTGLTSGPYYPFVTTGTSAGYIECNFGQKPFRFSVPVNYLPLSTSEFQYPLIKPQDYIGTVLYSGSGTGVPQNITFNFQPDLFWFKMRTSAGSYLIWDRVRGVNENDLRSNSTDIGYNAPYTTVSEITNGLNIRQDSPGNELSTSGEDYVAWGWKAGGAGGGFSYWKNNVGYSTASAAGLTAGDTTINGASIGTTNGFSIIKYIGVNDTSNHQVAHGLSKTPDFIITKNLDNSFNWDIYHKYSPNYLIFTNLAPRADGFNGPPSSSVINLQYNYSTLANHNYIAYCWHDVEGLQKFGFYSGNNDSNGAFVELGFRPSIVWAKRVSGGAGDWIIKDSSRYPFNNSSDGQTLVANVSNSEDGYYTATQVAIDLVSNGFKIRHAGGPLNDASSSYIYCAWAETPYAWSNAH